MHFGENIGDVVVSRLWRAFALGARLPWRRHRLTERFSVVVGAVVAQGDIGRVTDSARSPAPRAWTAEDPGLSASRREARG